MKVVVDTNVFVSAALKDKSPAALALRSIPFRGIPIVQPAAFVAGATQALPPHAEDRSLP